MSRAAPDLATEVASLRAELALADARILALEEAVAQLRATDRLGAPVTVNYTVTPAPDIVQASLASSAAAPNSGSPDITDTERRQDAIAVGHFLRRALDGLALDPPRAHRARLPARCYVLCRDVTGTEFNPVQFFRSFAPLKPLVREGEATGRQSVFAGFPSQWEARLAVETARLTWPANGGN